MADYTIAIQKDSNIYKLYQKLKDDGVKDADLDTGYPETDFVNKTRTAVHKGDYQIDAKEVLNYALEHYERYQLAIKETTGSIVPWSLDDLDPSTDFDAQIRAKVDKAINAFKQIVAGKGLKPGSGRYDELLAVALYAFTLAGPTRQLGGQLAIRLPGKIEEKLEREGLNGVIDFLKVNGGGLALSEHREDCTIEGSALTALANSCGECTEHSEVLYGVFSRAGLKVKYLSVIPGLAFNKKIKKPPGLLHTAVSVTLGDRKQIFDVGLALPDAAPFYKKNDFVWWYEQTGREFLAAYYNNLGESLDGVGESALAREAYRAAVKIDPGSIEAHHDLGVSYYLTGEIERAIKELKIAISNPYLIDPHYFLGLAYLKNGEPDLAIRECGFAAKAAPEIKDSHDCLGKAFADKGSQLEREGKKAEAAEAQRRSQEEFKKAGGFSRP